MVKISEEYFGKVISALILIALAILSFFLLKPILMSIVLALILAFIFSPVYDWLLKKIKSKNLSVSIIMAFLLIIIILPIWFLTPVLIEQSFKMFQASQQIDFVTPLKKVFPGLFVTEQFSNEIGSIISSFTSRSANFLVNFFADMLLNFPTLFLQLTVVFFTFYFVLRDKKEVIEYLYSLSPFSKDVEKKLFDSSRGIAASVIYGQVIVGIIQGIVVGIGFFAFGVSNALILTLLSILAGVFPVIGTTMIWLPVAIYLIIAENTFSAIGVLIFGILSSSLDNFIRPMIVSKRTNLHTAVVVVGMIGGLFLFGILGIILGPLILAYLIIILETYKKKNSPDVFITESKSR